MRHVDHWRGQLLRAEPGNEPGVMGVHTIEGGLYGALGVHSPLELGAFAVLTPWMVVPTITEATLFVTDFDTRMVDICHLVESVDGVAHVWTRAAWRVDDYGAVVVADVWPGSSPSGAITYALASAIAARRDGAYWSEGLTFDRAVNISRHLIDTYLR